jgi:hypothetical protein
MSFCQHGFIFRGTDSTESDDVGIDFCNPGCCERLSCNKKEREKMMTETER